MTEIKPRIDEKGEPVCGAEDCPAFETCVYVLQGNDSCIPAIRQQRDEAKVHAEAAEAQLEAIRKPISFIADRMVGQDNRITEHPIFMVQSRRRVYGVDTDYCDKCVWMYDGEEVVDTDGDVEEWLREVGMTMEQAEAHDLAKVGVHDYWESVQPFFSLEGAEAYIKANRYRMTAPRVFAESAYRNDEWQAVRTALLDTPSKEGE